MKIRILSLCIILAFSNLGAEEERATLDVPIGIEMALQHYQITKNGWKKLKTWPDEDFPGSPTQVLLDKQVSTLKQVQEVLALRPEKLKKRHPVHSILERDEFFVVVLSPLSTNDPKGEKYDGKRLHHAYLIPKNSSHLVYWMNW
jgi:hypothetical protein